MDKVHATLAVLKKRHFWVLCVLILIASTVFWMMAVDNLDAEAQQNLQRIQATMSDAKAVASISQHPNDQITAAYNAQTSQLKQEVFQVWNELYKKQRDTVLKWPPALGEDFIKHVDSTPFLGPIPVDFRDIYFNYVKTRWAELPKIIKARAVSVEDNNPRRTSQNTTTNRAIPDYIVIWADQERIRKDLFSVQRPTTEWVWLTQEDLWIYENLLNIIKKTNSGAIGPHNAVISTISSMNVGKSAAGDASGTGSRISGSSGGDAGDSEGDSGGAPTGLLNGRYIDAAGKPLADGIKARDDEYKRIPVRLVLQMDSREVPLLILTCANAPLPVEVQQVHINAEGGGGADSPAKSPELSAEDRAAGRKTPHVEVTLQGVIYIFNPPNREKLKLPEEPTAGSATEAFATQGGTEATTPAFEDETAAEGTTPATATDPTAAPATGTTEPTGTETAPPADGTVTPAAPVETTPETATTPPAEAPKGADIESLFEDEKPAPAPANP